MGALFKLYKSDGITEITNIKSVVYREAVNTGEHLKPGCVCSAAIEVEIFSTQANALNAGDVVYCYAVDKNNAQTLLGKFNCEPKIDTKNRYKITAHDNALKLNADFSQWLQANQSNFPMTISALVSEACTVAGVTLGSTSWPLSAENVQAFYADGITCRDILSYAAELAGRFVRCHTDGDLYFEWYAQATGDVEVGGAVASFNSTLALPLVKSSVTITPTQSGSGDPSPQNIRPIAGYDGARLWHSAENLLEGLSFINNSYYNSSGGIQVSANTKRINEFLPCTPGEKYFVSGVGVVTQGQMRIHEYDENQNWLRQVANALVGEITWTASADAAYYRFSCAKVLTDVKSGHGEPFDVSWQADAGTVYGGVYDYADGKLTVTHGNIASYNGESINEPWLSSMDVYEPGATPTTGAQVVYPLTTPLEFSLSAESISAFVGENNLWTSVGDTDVIYADVKKIAPSAGTNQYAYKQDGLEYANYQTAALARVAVHPSGEDDVAYIYPTGVTSGNTLHVKNNLLLTGADASLYNAAAQQVFSAVSAVGQYSPMSVKLFPKESPFRAGDIVLVTDAQSVTIDAPVTSMTISNAASTLLSDGREVYEDETNTSSALTQLASDVVRINKLKVGWAEIDTAIVNYLSANNVTAQNLTIVDENDNVLATFNSNGINLGQSNEAHAEIDFNSFELKDKNGNTYALFGDMRGADGTATVLQEETGDGVTTAFYIYFLIDSVDSILVDGVATSDYTFSGHTLTFATAPSDGSLIAITYHTQSPFYRYDVGCRRSGSAIGGFSLAEGYYTIASGYCSHAEGLRATASGIYSHAEGHNTDASGSSSHAEGESTESSGSCSHAEGKQTHANGQISHAEGYLTYANGICSHAEGYRTKASSYAQHAGGKFNIEDTNNTYAEIIGNGTDDNNRSNARTLDWGGNEQLAGGLTLGTPLGLASGGTDANNADDAFVNLSVKGAVATNTDLDTIIVPGVYQLESSNTYTNIPTGVTFGILSVMAVESFASQEITTSGGDTYKRFYSNSTWSAWKAL